ncbi:D-alanine-D-alanine ligase [Limimonas halophila]|uniref:D-alanine-D-alanine ligase n=1 Tax=Limimonas halophila TaxID=1082479 RepID=A0A1G7UA92_9PROT|nr:ATP-grasp domain-containing protein [Limimonas halophila]SDG44383.1 D-alanine-D-alanine ligase [Limimonas halophila]
MALDLAVLLGDPRLPYSYTVDGRFSDADHAAVARLKAALDALDGVACRYLEDHGRLIADLTAAAPDLVLNFCNTGLGNDPARQLHVPALLEALGHPYVGADARALAVCHDKALVMAAAAALGIPVPATRLVDGTDPPADPAPSYPAIVKPNDGDGSIGITAGAVVRTSDAARAYLADMTASTGRRWAVVQAWLPGAEYSVAMVGNPEPGFAELPPLQLDFSRLPPGAPPILPLDGKIDPASPYYGGVRLLPADLDAAGQRQLRDQCARVFARLGLRDYARFDWRADAAGVRHLIDVNAHPMWGADGMMATMAGFAGDSYAGYLRRVIAAGTARNGLAVPG